VTVRLPLAVGYAKAMELIITGRLVDAQEALRIGLANEVVPTGKTLERALELAREIAELPQGAIRSDKETMVRNVGRPYEEQLRTELEMTLSMFMRRDSHAPRGPGIQGGADARMAPPRPLSRVPPGYSRLAPGSSWRRFRSAA
jgi:enoyl-CoA hydratase/carnithine racemase